MTEAWHPQYVIISSAKSAAAILFQTCAPNAELIHIFVIWIPQRGYGSPHRFIPEFQGDTKKTFSHCLSMSWALLLIAMVVKAELSSTTLFEERRRVIWERMLAITGAVVSWWGCVCMCVIAVIPLLLTRQLLECVGADLICGLRTHALMNPRPSDLKGKSPPAGVLPSQLKANVHDY